MTPALKLNVFCGFPAYGSNGGTSQEHPDIRDWWCETLLAMKADPRVGEITTHTMSDTPITMVRNQFVKLAKQNGAHLLLMIDSDQSPSKHKGERWFKPFWQEAFDFVYANYLKGPHVVGAPYCGPPDGSENVYVFKWENYGDRGEETNFKLEAYSRAEAEKMSGIQEAAALPTGLILYDMRAFELIEPSKLTKRQVLEALLSGELTVQEAEASLYEGYFHYEWNNQYADEKGSTEDVSNTRNIAMNGIVKLGYNPIYCAWDSWIGHWKPWNVGKPKSHKTEHIGSVFKKIVQEDSRMGEQIVDLKLPSWAKDDRNFQKPPEPANQAVAQNGQPKIKRPYWNACGDALRYLERFAKGLVVDIGPGNYPFARATEFVGRQGKVRYGKPFHDLDLNCDRLPYDDQTVDFVYCRHVIEDLANPEHLLKEIRRVAKAGYIETPSPISECCHGVDHPALNDSQKGYIHHRSIVWSDGKTLSVVPKYPALETLDIPERYDLLNDGPRHWGSYHLWQGALQFTVLHHEVDFDLGQPGSYQAVIERACAESIDSAEAFAEAIGNSQWCDVQATCDEHLAALAREVRVGDRVLEVGTWLGDSAKAMADAGATVHCVDTWAGTENEVGRQMADVAGGPDAVFAEFLSRIGDRWDKSIIPWRRPSLEAAAMHWDKFDLIFIDADHSYEATKADILAWWPHLKDDGVMLGHDYGTIQFPGVDKAVHELFGGRGFEALADCGSGSIWKVHKSDFPNLLERFSEAATA